MPGVAPHHPEIDDPSSAVYSIQVFMVGLPATFFHPSRSVSIGVAALRPNFVTLLFATRHSLSIAVLADVGGLSGCHTSAATISLGCVVAYFQSCTHGEQGQ